MTVLILVRHGHREISDREANNGLSAKGKLQSRKILRYFKRRFGRFEKTEELVLISSPKRRCVETLQPVARHFGRKLRVSDLLLEAQRGESQASLRARVKRALAQASARRGVVVLCSHGDWLPLAIKRLTGARAKLEKGSVAEVEDGELVRLLQPGDLGDR